MFRPRTLCQVKPAPTEQQVINPHKSSLPSDYFTRIPTYDGGPKEFPSKTKKPLQLTTKGYLVQKIDRKGVEDIHHIHIWSIDGYKNYATMHIVTKVKNIKALKKEIREELEEHNICHSILETEDETCDDTECNIKAETHIGHHHHH